MQHAPFVHLHVHTQYSLLDGGIRLKDLFERAQAFKLPAVAMTDRDGLYGAARFVRACQREGVAPILGASITVRASEESLSI